MKEYLSRKKLVRMAIMASLFLVAAALATSRRTAQAQAPTPDLNSASSAASSVDRVKLPAPPSSPPTTSSLTDDLLDLLTEPTSHSQTEKRKPTRPADVQLEGEDLGEQPPNPLQAVRQSMLIAAGFLERGQTDAGTQQLQSDIVKRLDELINRLDQPPNPPNQPPASQQSQSQNTAEQRDSQPQQPTARSKQSQARQSQLGDGEQTAQQSQPSGSDISSLQQRSPRSAQVQLADPKALQQQVWGQLPERTRQQMQSRMVEQFLPSYRQEIEAYYRALAK